MSLYTERPDLKLINRSNPANHSNQQETGVQDGYVSGNVAHSYICRGHCEECQMTRNLCFTDAEHEEGGARMLLTPADRGPGARPARERSAQAEGWLAAPVSELAAPMTPPATSFAQPRASHGGFAEDG